LNNALKIGKSLNSRGKRSVLSKKVLNDIPGMDNLFREADFHIERHNNLPTPNINQGVQDKDDEEEDQVMGSDGDSNEKQHCDDHRSDSHDGSSDNEVDGDNRAMSTKDNKRKDFDDEEDSDREENVKEFDVSQPDEDQYVKQKSGMDNRGVRTHDNTTVKVMDLSSMPKNCCINDLWTKQNSHENINRAVNILADRYARKQKSASREHYSSVKDLIFRYMCTYGVCFLHAEEKEAVTAKEMPNKYEATTNKPPIVAVAIIDMYHEIECGEGRKGKNPILEWLYCFIQR
jgi:hypothetical protein